MILGEQLYPTNDREIELMLKKVQEKTRGIIKQPFLEPSAGMGNILDYICKKADETTYAYRYYPCKRDMYCMEIDPTLRYSLQGKGYKVLASDFLEYPVDEKKFNTILMNPPFANGIDHLFHAWELLDSQGVLCCLLNAESVLSPINKPRQRLLELINLYGDYEILGQVFKDSERTTDVNVVCVTLQKPKLPKKSIFDDVDFEKDYTDWSTISPEALTKSDQIADLVARYNACVEILRRRNQEQAFLEAYLKGISSPVYGCFNNNEDKECFEMAHPIEEQIEVLKSKFWCTVFERTKIGQRTTKQYREQFEKGASVQASMAFTVQNVKEVLELFLCNQGEIMEQCIVGVFEQCTRYHKKNIIHSEGWATNKSSKLNYRIIHPGGVKMNTYESRPKANYYYREFFDDLDKACCFLSGQVFEKINTIYRTIDDHLDDYSKPYDEKIESTFFKIRCFKKGTVHLDFLDRKLLDDFNQVVASARGKEIGPNY